MALIVTEGNFESNDDCFYSDNETIDPDSEFQEFLEKTKENLIRLSESCIRIGEGTPLENASFSLQLNQPINDTPDNLKEFSSDVKNYFPAPVKNVKSENLYPIIDVSLENQSDISHNDSDLGFSNFITQMRENLQDQNTNNHKPCDGSNSSIGTSPDDSGSESSEDERKTDIKPESKYNYKSFDESLISNGNSSADGEDFENFISRMKDNLQSKYLKNLAVPLHLKSKNSLRPRCYSLASEGLSNQADSIPKISLSLTTDTEFNLIDAEAEAKFNFMKKRKVYAQELYEFFNKAVFNNRLPNDMLLKWSGQLKSTAGKTFCSRKKALEKYEYFCYIELSTDVLISFARLRDTLLHEMCHAACWLVNHASDNHGPLWRTWASRCNLILPQITVPSRCHTYELSFAYTLKCVSCDFVRRRHHMCPKLKRKVCPICRNPTVLTHSG